MERSFNQDTFYGGNFNGFTPGISATRNLGSDDQAVVHYGLYKPINNVFGYSTGTGITRWWCDSRGCCAIRITAAS